MSLPILVKSIERSYLFGFLQFRIVVEDRRPDLTSEEAQRSLGYKFKTQVSFKLFKLEYYVVVHSLNAPHIGIYK